MTDQTGDNEDVLELEEEVSAQAGDDVALDADDGGEVAVIGFADEGEEEVEATPLVKRLRDQIRERDKRIATMAKRPAAVEDDPEPSIPARKRLEDFDYDQDRFDDHDDLRTAALTKHAEWKVRQVTRQIEQSRESEMQARQIEQQRRALRVGDYEEFAEKVRERLSEQQLAVLVQASDNPAQMIYALGRSEGKLEQLAAQDNLARLAALVGKLEKDIKVTKRKAPPPEGIVRGATASTAIGGVDREEQRLEKLAENTGDRSQLLAYRRAKRTKT